MAHRRHPRQEDLERLAAVRYFRGGPHFGGGPMFGGGRGRKRRGDVRAALLLLLAEEPRNGYQLMQAIEERSGGRWRPSPGATYPALAQLEDEGLIRATDLEGTRAFELTDAGREHLAERGEHPAPWDDEDGSAPDDIRPLIAQVASAAWQVGKVGNEHQVARATEALAETRRALYRILAEDEPAED
jgi:DNA-binding PadR family transcriptional regulator